MFILTLIGIAGTVVLWRTDQPVWAALFGILFIGGAGWGFAFRLLSGLVPRPRRRMYGRSGMTELLDAADHPARPSYRFFADDVRVRLIGSTNSGDLWTYGDLCCEPDGTVTYAVSDDGGEGRNWPEGKVSSWSTSTELIDGTPESGLLVQVDKWHLFVKGSSPYSPLRMWLNYFRPADRVSKTS